MSESNIIFYATPNGQVSVQVQYENGSFWLTQKRMAELFSVESHTITYHLKEIYKSNELQIDSTTRKIRVVQQEGKRDISRELDFYNLDTIIAVGYRVYLERWRPARKYKFRIAKTLTSIKTEKPAYC